MDRCLNVLERASSLNTKRKIKTNQKAISVVCSTKKIPISIKTEMGLNKNSN